MTTEIHPSSVVEAGAEIGENVQIGPFCYLGPNIKLGDNCKLHSNVVVTGHTTLGNDTEIFPFASIGHVPQDLKFEGEESALIIGKRNKIREYVTMNPGTKGGGMITKVGDGCLFMVGAHVAHDCDVGDHVIMANNATLAGHVTLGDHVIIGGLSAVHQFVRVGHHAMVGGMTGVEFDIIPFGQVQGDRAYLSGLNLVGLKRGNYGKEKISKLRAAYRMLFADEGTAKERVKDVATTFGEEAEVMEIVEFMRAESQRGITQPKSSHET
ncbi:MAG TPA: acyl-[acyl-carrier-protein]--UDP-N-acetylglucosamine O-acyltransferase [Rhodospirillaceae bacterium]|nr:acyl-[acyl-carrier-protein]--UDP-N-acetylglucosamine O-acyltransferase [Rhodospirillaceae bacterium]MBL25423.1 acyl-[acyl-carrier-protein]--UDP-N-acetylglucosamine O-acyltransferase [Rhodospirillaceae bacterium]HAA91622.1 acyl-[acyl-carrier-protein]--UDP-N-acetylglucosamine O-acyltransferase [Rhodospirillaceae bacterium]HAT36079.1 acyl-[acyl-carrier-protein]--UDP-N-acetylglucosamine O-acyltransferase [Rhodospirillaceae bacterium]